MENGPTTGVCSVGVPKVTTTLMTLGCEETIVSVGQGCGPHEKTGRGNLVD